MFANKWTRNEKLALGGIAIAIMACAATILVPEVRALLGLNTSPAPPITRNSTESDGENTNKPRTNNENSSQVDN